MEQIEIKALVLKYNEGVADPAEIRQLETLIENGTVQLHELVDLHMLDEQIAAEQAPEPSLALDDRFYRMIGAHRKAPVKSLTITWPAWDTLIPRLAYAAAILLAGVAGGYWIGKPSSANPEIVMMAREISSLKEMMMLSLLEKESASERLRAVSLTTGMDQASHKVTSALIETLNRDVNVNVRLAALDALRGYIRDNTVRTELIKSIAQQDSPLVQIALAELMRDIQEKRSVREFDKLLQGNKTPTEVKNRIKENIQILI